MKTLSLSISLFLFIFNCSAQTDTKIVIRVNDKDKTFAHIEREAIFPGGSRGWLDFLQENLVYPKKARKKNIQGTVVVTFLVNVDGTLSDIQVANGPEELREAATDVIKKSPNWIPATIDGKKTKSYKKQPVGFALQ